MTSRAEVVAEALTWQGTPWQHQASLKGIGCDCIGLVAGVAAALGLPEAKAWAADPRFRGYGRLPVAELLLEAVAVYLEPLELERAGPGDVLVMTFKREPMHFAFIAAADPCYMLHAYEPAGRVALHRLDEKWRRRILSAHRLRGVA